MLEPVGRNSAPAIAAAALLVAETNPDAVLWMMAADAAIADTRRAAPSARDAPPRPPGPAESSPSACGPPRPETGYGYIEARRPAARRAGRLRGRALHRKAGRRGGRAPGSPPAGTCGTPACSSSPRAPLLEETGHALPRRACVRCAPPWPARQADLDFIRLGVDAFAACPSISLDYAVAERTDRAAVVPADLGWSDVGSWGALWELGTRTQPATSPSATCCWKPRDNCYVRSDGMLTAVVGLEDAVVVVTEDAVLAMHRDRAQDVKKVVDRLKAAGRHEAVAHNRRLSPVGLLREPDPGRPLPGEAHRRRSPGRKLSLQKHFHRAEHWVVVNGSALVTRDDETVLCARTRASICRSAACTGWRTPARSR